MFNSLATGESMPGGRAGQLPLAEPDLEFWAFGVYQDRLVNPQLERAWHAWQARRYQRGETSQRPGSTDNPFRLR